MIEVKIGSLQSQQTRMCLVNRNVITATDSKSDVCISFVLSERRGIQLSY